MNRWTPVFEKKIVRQGRRATEWMSDHGIESTPSTMPQLTADRFTGAELEITRLWHNPGRYEYYSDIRDGARLLIPLEGALVLRSFVTEDVAVTPGMIALLSARDPFTLATDEPTARIELRVARTLIGVEIPPPGGAAIRRVDPGYRSLLIDMVNSTFRATTEVDSTAFSFVQTALEQLTAALLVDSFPASTDKDVFERALAVIALGAIDTRLTVKDVCHRMDVSSRTLQRLFAKNGTTIFNEIRLARYAAAQKAIEDDDRRTSDDPALNRYLRSGRAKRDSHHYGSRDGTRALHARSDGHPVATERSARS